MCGAQLPLLEVRVSLPDLDPLAQCTSDLNSKRDDIPQAPLAASLTRETSARTCSLSLPMERGPRTGKLGPVWGAQCGEPSHHPALKTPGLEKSEGQARSAPIPSSVSLHRTTLLSPGSELTPPGALALKQLFFFLEFFQEYKLLLPPKTKLKRSQGTRIKGEL